MSSAVASLAVPLSAALLAFACAGAGRDLVGPGADGGGEARLHVGDGHDGRPADAGPPDALPAIDAPEPDSTSVPDGDAEGDPGTEGFLPDFQTADAGGECELDADCANGLRCLLPEGLCVQCLGDLECGDGNVCTLDYCSDEHECEHKSKEGSCYDDDICTVNDVCSNGVCVSGTPASCDDKNPCTTDFCEAPAGCKSAPNMLPCDDGDSCTANDKCTGGKCVGQQTMECDDGNACTDDLCVEGVGCAHVYNTAPCSDANACTGGDHCSNGSCVAGKPISCDDGNPCTTDSCNQATGCVHNNNTLNCDDGDACTSNDKCSGGKCSGTPLVCSDGNACTQDSCTPGGGCAFSPLPDGSSCNDGNPCTGGDACMAGACKGAPMPGCCTTASECDDGNKCTADSCVLGKCAHTNICCTTSADCDDKDVCTQDQCVGGLCVHSPTGAEGCCKQAYFRDDFSTDKGWEYGLEWERGPAKASAGGGYGGPDPAGDHTSTGDNNVAGVKIGGNAAQNIHDFHWLTSPPVSTQGSTDLHVYFWRWLNSDYLPFMQNKVQVFDGTGWVDVWTTGGSPGVQDKSWTFVDFKVQQWSNPQFRVRFGFMIGSGGVFSVSSWNLDDVTIANAPAPGAMGLCCGNQSDCDGIYPAPVSCAGGTCKGGGGQ